MKRWGTVTLTLFAFVIGFVSTYSCGGGSRSNAADYAPLVHTHAAGDITSGVLGLDLIPAHSHTGYAYSVHGHDVGDILGTVDAGTLDGKDSIDFALSIHSHPETQELEDALCFLSRVSGWKFTGYDFNANCFQRVFVTSSSFMGNFGGGAGGDAICQTRAESAQLQGVYKAWLASLEAGTPSPSNSFVKSPYPYVLVDGTLVANDWEDLIDGTLIHPIDKDENGLTVTNNTGVWANVTVDGNEITLSMEYNCNNWQTGSAAVNGNIGSVLSTNAAWTVNGHSSCGELNRLYCFQQ